MYYVRILVIIVVEVTSIQNPDSLTTFIWAERNEILTVSLYVRIANLARLYPITKFTFGRWEIFRARTRAPLASRVLLKLINTTITLIKALSHKFNNALIKVEGKTLTRAHA